MITSIYLLFQHSVTYYSILNELIAMYAIGVPAESRLHNTQTIQKTTMTGLEPAIPRSEVWCLIH